MVADLNDEHHTTNGVLEHGEHLSASGALTHDGHHATDKASEQGEHHATDKASEQGEHHAAEKDSVLLISPEMAYTGALNSLLRMAKVLKKSGYGVEIWTAKSGPFEAQFAKFGFEVKCVPPQKAGTKEIISRAKRFCACICNAIGTAPYVAALRYHLPVVFYIREASNLPFFLEADPLRAKMLARHSNVVCVSDYAAQFLAQYRRRKIGVVNNSVEDMAQFVNGSAADNLSDGLHDGLNGGSHGGSSPDSLSAKNPSSDKVVFIQLGSIEARKGYDVFLRAYEQLPQSYKERSCIKVAGATLQSSSNFSTWFLSELEKCSGAQYLGLLTDQVEKTRVISEADVVVVASRDESCSLPALEACMLSKPLIVTENVGAKYMVADPKLANIESATPELAAEPAAIEAAAEPAVAGTEPAAAGTSNNVSLKIGTNGAIVQTGSVQALTQAMMYMIDKKSSLQDMGKISRQVYEEKASMQTYEKNIVQMIEDARANFHPLAEKLFHHETVLGQKKKPFIPQIEKLDEVDNFLELALPQVDVYKLRGVGVGVKANKANKAAIEGEFTVADLVVRTGAYLVVQKGVAPNKEMLSSLMSVHQKCPHAISCNYAHLLTFEPDGAIRGSEGWLYDYHFIRDAATYQLLADPRCGILVPKSFVKNPVVRAMLKAYVEIVGEQIKIPDFAFQLAAAAAGYPTILSLRYLQEKPKLQKELAQKMRMPFEQQDECVKRAFKTLNCLSETAREDAICRIRGITLDGLAEIPGKVSLKRVSY